MLINRPLIRSSADSALSGLIVLALINSPLVDSQSTAQKDTQRQTLVNSDASDDGAGRSGAAIRSTVRCYLKQRIHRNEREACYVSRSKGDGLPPLPLSLS